MPVSMSVRQALLFSLLDRYAGLVLALGSSIVIARLITPDELGVYSVTMVVVSFASSFRDLGAGQYLVQERELNAQRIAATWTVLAGCGLALGVLALALAKPVAWFYGDSRIVGIMAVLSLNFLISPAGSLTYAWLTREMQFGALALMRLAGSTAGAIVSIGLAWRDFGAISLAWGSLAATISNALISSFFRPAHFPWRPSLTDVRRVLSTGTRFSVTALLNNLINGMPELVVGKLQGLGSAGLFSRASGLAAMFNRLVLDATYAVAMPVFAREVRMGGSLEAPFLRSLAYVTVLGWSFFGGLALLAQPVLQLLYGHQWDGAVTVTRWLAVAFAIGLPATLIPTAMNSAGAIDKVMRTTVKVLAIQTAGVLLGAWHGLDAAAAGYAAAQPLCVALWIRTGRSTLQLRTRPLLKALSHSALVAAATVLAPLCVVLVLGLAPETVTLAIAASVGGGLLLFGATAIRTRHPIHEELDRLVQRLRRGRAPGGAGSPP